MDVASDNEVQNNQSDQEDNNSLIIQSDNEESHNVQSSPISPEQRSNGNSESEHDSDGDCHKKQNDETSDNEIEEKENCEVESAGEVNSDDEHNVQSEGEQEGASDRELEPEASATPLPSDNEVHHSDDEAEHSDNEVHHSDDEAEHSDNEVHRSDEEVQHSDNEVQHSDNEVQHSDNEVQHSDNEVQHSDNEVQHSDNEVQRSDEEAQHSDEEVHHSDVDIQQSDEDVEAQHSDDEAEMPRSDEEQEHSYHSDDEVHRSDEEVHRSDDEQSFPPSPAESIEEKAEASDDENMKINIPENILAVTDNEDSDADIDSDSGNESKVGELIADIFGESDEDEEFEGFGEEDLAAAKERKEKKKATVLSDSEEDEEGNLTIMEEQKPEIETVEEGDADGKRKDVLPVISDEEDSDAEMNSRMPGNFVYDFEVMMQKKKDSQRRRKRNDIDLINDSDDLIGEIIAQMKEVAEEDRQLNKNKCAATKKLKLLPMVASQLRKHDLKETFLDKGILNVMTDWLSPLPDRSLPHLQIRDAMFRLLQEFPPIDQVLLKSSNIGRAVMYLYKHPKETKENRERAGKLISEWARPIFNLTTNFHSMSKEEREQRDFEHMPKKRKLRLETGEVATMKQDIDKALVGEDKALRPGEKGWIARARVPTPSMRDYVVRPKWNTEADFSRGSSRKPTTRLDKHIRNLKEKKKLSKVQRAVTISIEGRKMAL